MGVGKGGIFSKIGVYKSMDSSSKLPTSDSSSLGSNDEPIPFLLNMLNELGGETAVSEGLGGVISESIDETEDGLKESLENQLTTPESDSDIKGSQLGQTKGGIDFDIEEIDVFGNLEESNPEEGSFNYALESAISNDGTSVEHNGMNIKFNKNTQKVIITVGVATTLGAFIGNYLSNTKLFNKKEIMSSAMDELFGSISNKNKISEAKLVKQAKVSKVIENLIAGDDSMELNLEALNEILDKARDRANGVTRVRVGCCMVDYEVPFEDLQICINDACNADDRFGASKAVTKLIDNNLGGGGKDGKLGFVAKIINSLVVKMVEAATVSPEVRTLMGIVSAFKNNGVPELGDPIDDLKNNVVMVKCLTKTIQSSVVEYLYKTTESELTTMMKPIVKTIIKEKTDSYMKILQSLVNK